MGRGVNHILWENLREKDHFEDVGIGVASRLIRIFKQWVREAWTGWI
jgi:hypothetical protein